MVFYNFRQISFSLQNPLVATAMLVIKSQTLEPLETWPEASPSTSHPSRPLCLAPWLRPCSSLIHLPLLPLAGPLHLPIPLPGTPFFWLFAPARLLLLLQVRVVTSSNSERTVLPPNTEISPSPESHSMVICVPSRFWPVSSIRTGNSSLALSPLP